jgi:hypothetical protein
MNTVHVSRDAAGWTVKLEGFEVPVATFRLESDALLFGRDYSTRHQVTLVVHSPDGTVRFRERPVPRGPAGG